MLKVLILFSFLWLPFHADCQSFSEEISLSLKQNDILKLLPPLQSLIDSAVVHSPLLKISDADIIIRSLRVESLRNEWLGNFGIESGIRYGLFENLILADDLGIDEFRTSSTVQTRYNVGLFLRLSISDIIDRRNVKIAKQEMNQANYQRDQLLSELRQLIISQYFDIVKIHKGMIIKNEMTETYRIQMYRAEEDYINGMINIADYSRLKSIFSQSILDLEEIKVDFLLAVQLLEEIVGTKIELKESEW